MHYLKLINCLIISNGVRKLKISPCHWARFLVWVELFNTTSPPKRGVAPTELYAQLRRGGKM